MFRGVKNFLIRDDRTGLPSITRFIRIMAWACCLYYLGMLGFIILSSFPTSEDSMKIIDLIKDFLVFIIPTVEASYQFNRKAKIDSPGMADLVEELARRENEIYFAKKEETTIKLRKKKETVINAPEEEESPVVEEEKEDK